MRSALLVLTLLALGAPWLGFPAPCAASLPAADDDEPVRLDFAVLMDFEYKKGSPIPESIRKYEGKEVEISGYMDSLTPEDTRQFFLMSASCACDGQVKLNHFVDVSLSKQVVGFQPGTVKVVGRFRISEVVEDDFVVSIFQIEGRVE